MNAWNEKSGETSDKPEESKDLTFEDNFEVSNPESNSNSHRLEDSEQYLARLESRLHKIKTNPDVLKQLAERREACMNSLLNSGEDYLGTSENEVDFDQPLGQNETASEIFRHIKPEQPQTVGEIVHFIKHDQFVDKEDYVADSNSDSSSLADR